MESFGTYLRNLRKDKGLNQTQLAALLNLDMSAISKIENRKIQLKESLLSKVAEIFGLNLDLLKEKYFSDKIAQEVYKNGVPETVFAIAEKKVKYYKIKNSNQMNMNFRDSL